MGAGFSAACSPPPSTGLGDLPENCVAEILMRLDPPQICNLARLSRTFHMASSANFVWESKLPSNYRFLVKKVLGESHENLRKKEIYARLCRANRFDGGHKVVRVSFFFFFLFYFWLFLFSDRGIVSVGSLVGEEVWRNLFCCFLEGIEDNRNWWQKVLETFASWRIKVRPLIPSYNFTIYDSC